MQRLKLFKNLWFIVESFEQSKTHQMGNWTTCPKYTAYQGEGNVIEGDGKRMELTESDSDCQNILRLENEWRTAFKSKLQTWCACYKATKYKTYKVLNADYSCGKRSKAQAISQTTSAYHRAVKAYLSAARLVADASSHTAPATSEDKMASARAPCGG